MTDAMAHGIKVSPPRLAVSKSDWCATQDGLVAGWRQIPGCGEKMATRIDGHLASLDGARSLVGWEDLKEIHGVGPKKIDTMRSFSTARDPFGLKRTEEAMTRALDFIDNNIGVPFPTHTGAEVAAIPVREEYGAAASEQRKKYGQGPLVIYAGIVKSRNMQDIVENRRSRTGEEAEDILRDLHRPDLLAYCSLRCYDTTQEEVYLRVNRYRFPNLKRTIESIVEGHDVVVAVGNRIAGFGTPVMVNELYVIDPD